MATVTYFLRSKAKNAQIYCRLSAGRGNKPIRKTGYVCSPKDWSEAKGLPKGKDENQKELQTKLSELATAIISRYNTDQANGARINSQWLQAAIDLHFNRVDPVELEYLTTYSDHFLKNLKFKVSDSGQLGVKEGTYKRYKVIHNKLKAFEKHTNQRLTLKGIDLNFRAEFIQYLSEVEHISDNTIGKYVSIVKTIVLDARKNGFEISPQIADYKGFSKKAPKVTLTFDEIEQLQSISFEDEVLEAAKDWLIIACYTGQRVSDLLRMSRDMVSKHEGFEFITLTQVKTGKMVQIPLHDAVSSILAKRGSNFPPVFSKHGESNSTLFNRHIKTVCRLAEINEPTEGNLYNPKTKRYQAGTFPKWQLVSSHIGRRSFATNFYADQKYPTPLLMSITGHSSEKMFLVYIGKQPMDYGLQLAKTWANEAANKKEGKLRVIKNASNQ